MIPKTLYLYWGGRKLSWLRYLTVASFCELNPDWKVKVYYPVKPNMAITWNTEEQQVRYEGEDYFNRLAKYATLVSLDMRDIGSSNEHTEVHKSDIFRLWVLVEHGGYYSDFDILFVRPMPEIKQSRVYCLHPHKYYSIGFLGAIKGDQMYKELLDRALISTGKKYQSLGSTMWGNVLQEKPTGYNLPKYFVYHFSSDKVEDIFSKTKKLHPKAVGIHWFGGSQYVGREENKLTPDNYQEHPSTLTPFIQKTLNLVTAV